jgi:ectoine hydroxylase-related dioxygenase (phytanoyl-CoA dioxygenase family)
MTTLPPGDAIVHHVRTVHGSTGNGRADGTRRALALRYLGRAPSGDAP